MEKNFNVSAIYSSIRFSKAINFFVGKIANQYFAQLKFFTNTKRYI